MSDRYQVLVRNGDEKWRVYGSRATEAEAQEALSEGMRREKWRQGRIWYQGTTIVSRVEAGS